MSVRRRQGVFQDDLSHMGYWPERPMVGKIRFLRLILVGKIQMPMNDAGLVLVSCGMEMVKGVWSDKLDVIQESIYMNRVAPL